MELMHMRNRAEKRHNDWKKAIRKRKIVEEVYQWPEGWYDNLHQYSKNKIFCSCPLCRGLTKHGENDISDRRKLEKMKEQMFDNEQDF